MDSEMAGLEMVAVATPAHWSQFHNIRRMVLFEGRGRIGVYDENHPDDRAATNHPFLLLKDGAAVAAVRIDLFTEPRSATFRLLAVTPEDQRRGYGRALMQRAEQFARSQGCNRFVAHVAPDAIGFWEKMGYCVAVDQVVGTNPRMEKQVHEV